MVNNLKANKNPPNWGGLFRAGRSDSHRQLLTGC